MCSASPWCQLQASVEGSWELLRKHKIDLGKPLWFLETSIAEIDLCRSQRIYVALERISFKSTRVGPRAEAVEAYCPAFVPWTLRLGMAFRTGV